MKNSAPVEQYLKIGNWNLICATPSQSRFAEVVKYCNAQKKSDVWFLTETHQDLSPHHGYFGIHSGTPDRLFKSGEKWASIWAKRPLESLARYVTDSTRCVASRMIAGEFGEIILYGTVLPWNSDL